MTHFLIYNLCKVENIHINIDTDLHGNLKRACQLKQKTNWTCDQQNLANSFFKHDLHRKIDWDNIRHQVFLETGTVLIYKTWKSSSSISIHQYYMKVAHQTQWWTLPSARSIFHPKDREFPKTSLIEILGFTSEKLWIYPAPNMRCCPAAPIMSYDECYQKNQRASTKVDCRSASSTTRTNQNQNNPILIVAMILGLASFCT